MEIRRPNLADNCMTEVRLEFGCLTIRDFCAADEAAFVGYQTDVRYRALYDLDAAHGDVAAELFRQFIHWKTSEPRTNFQFGIFESRSGMLCGSVGLRQLEASHAELGIELDPAQWGRYRLALNSCICAMHFGFETLGLSRISGRTSSGNRRVEKLARLFGAEIMASRTGPAWMQKRNWQEVEWSLSRANWVHDKHSRIATPDDGIC